MQWSAELLVHDEYNVPDRFVLTLGARSSAVVNGNGDDSFELWA